MYIVVTNHELLCRDLYHTYSAVRCCMSVLKFMTYC